MLQLQKIIINSFIEELKRAFQQNYGNTESDALEFLVWAGDLALENIANCDALYHNVEHTIMVVAAGQQVLRGKHMLDNDVSVRDWLQVMLALLYHDIGYVRGICQADNQRRYASGVDGLLVDIPLGGTDAALAPYHVDRSKLFIRERFCGNIPLELDVNVIASYIEMTRFPIPNESFYKNTTGYAGLVRASDLIGQLADPNYLRKIPALFYEFEETGANEKTGYKNPENMRNSYADFYWNAIDPYIQEALRYLRVTAEGKEWIASLYSHVFAVEHGQRE